MSQIILLLVVAVLFFLFYLLIYSAFEDVGFRKWEALVIVFSVVIFGSLNLHLFYHNGWDVRINAGGALIPVVISVYLMASRRVTGRILLGIPLVAFVTYNVTAVTNEGIVSAFPYFLIPPFAASFYSVLVCTKSQKKSASIAYATGTLGVLVGADVFHLQELLDRSVPPSTVASIGGAAILDMVFLTGIIAVLVDAFLDGRERHDARDGRE
jgi:uncharacterized membrane protein